MYTFRGNQGRTAPTPPATRPWPSHPHAGYPGHDGSISPLPLLPVAADLHLRGRGAAGLAAAAARPAGLAAAAARGATASLAQPAMARTLRGSRGTPLAAAPPGPPRSLWRRPPLGPSAQTRSTPRGATRALRTHHSSTTRFSGRSLHCHDVKTHSSVKNASTFARQVPWLFTFPRRESEAGSVSENCIVN